MSSSASGGAAKLAFTTQPVGANGATAFGTQPSVTVQDAGGNTVVGNTSSVTLAITERRPARPWRLHRQPAARSRRSGDVRRLQDQPRGHVHVDRDRRFPGQRSERLADHHGRRGEPARLHHPARRRPATGDFPTQPVVTVQDAGGNTVVG